MIYQSKCSEINCGCIKITRNIQEEEKIDEMTINRQNNDIELNAERNQGITSSERLGKR
jgi:hypothetical protein